MFSLVFASQVPVEQLVDRYQVSCRAVRDLLVDYLRERQPAIDYGTLTSLATTLVLVLEDLERHHSGIDSLRLSPETATDALTTVRSFYLDLAQWALDDPVRWGPMGRPVSDPGH